VDLSADRTIASGTTIAVAGILIANESHNNISVEFQDASGNVAFTVVCGQFSSETVDWQFIADGGLLICGLPTGGGDVIVSIWHSYGGA
jgi:hypothetical protein